jgi:hypothetical protein
MEGAVIRSLMVHRDIHRDAQQRCLRRSSNDFEYRPCSSMSLKVLISRYDRAHFRQVDSEGE